MALDPSGGNCKSEGATKLTAPSSGSDSYPGVLRVTLVMFEVCHDSVKISPSSTVPGDAVNESIAGVLIFGPSSSAFLSFLMLK